MKIYIETEMTELTRTCRRCPVNDEWANGYRVCIPKDIYGKHGQNSRPDWCPLRTVTEIADKAKEKV